MAQTISATEANRKFSELLRHVQEGEEYIITSHGRPVAKIVEVDDDAARRREAKKRLMEHLRSVEVIDVGPWTREELYDD